jgi:hypothetical protein
MPQKKIREKLRDIELQRQRLTARLDETIQDLSEAARLVELRLSLPKVCTRPTAQCQSAPPARGYDAAGSP